MIVKYFHNSFDRQGITLHGWNVVQIISPWEAREFDGGNFIFVKGPFLTNLDAFLFLRWVNGGQITLGEVETISSYF